MSGVDIAKSHANRLGCSELAAALGLSRWTTPYMLWEVKTGRAEPADLSENLAVDLGNRLEQIVAELYSERVGSKVIRDLKEYREDDGVPLVGHIDRRVIDQKVGLEIKTSLGRFQSDEWGETGTDRVPMHYLIQCMGYLMLTGWNRWDLAVLMAGPEIRIYRILPDPFVFSEMRRGLREFWRCVETDTPPAPITLADASARWPKSSERPVAADAATREIARRLLETNAAIAALEKQADALELQLKERIQDGDSLVDYEAGRTIATWKSSPSNRIDVKRLREDHPKIAKDYTLAAERRVFKLKPNEAQTQ